MTDTKTPQKIPDLLQQSSDGSMDENAKIEMAAYLLYCKILLEKTIQSNRGTEIRRVSRMFIDTLKQKSEELNVRVTH